MFASGIRKTIARNAVAIPFLGLLFAGDAFPYSSTVTTTSDFPAGIARVAMLPLVGCPSTVDCTSMEKEIAASATKYSAKFQLVSPYRVNQLMMDLGISQIDETNGAAVAEKLNVDTFLVVQIMHAGRTTEGDVYYAVGDNMAMGIPYEVGVGNLEVRMIRAADGKALMKGSAFGKSEFYSEKGLIPRLFREVLEKAFGKPK